MDSNRLVEISPILTKDFEFKSLKIFLKKRKRNFIRDKK